jgi:hypothetical protein
MEKFSAHNFYQIGRLLREIRWQLQSYGDETLYIAMTESDTAIKQLRGIQSDCEKVGLKVSAKCAAHAAATLTSGNLVVKLVRELMSTLENTIEWEMEGHVFFYVPQEEADFYDQNQMLGDKIIVAFPDIQFDMVEAGNCYALGRATACVFHLMRIMEKGLQRLGVKLNISFAQDKNWQNILNEVNKALKSLDPHAPDTVDISQAASGLYAVKLGWRNPVMHPRETYTQEEAKALIQLVRTFMEHLAAIV